jgi:hypothetical protein
MWVNVEVRRSIHIAITWQPMPAVARLPSGTLVDVLCGHPEQKYGMRSSAILGFSSAASLALIQSTRALSFSTARGLRPRRRMRCAITRAIIAGVSSEVAGSSQSPCGRTHSPFSSNLPTTRGRTSSRQL